LDASDESFAECHERAINAAYRSHRHLRILLCGTLRAVVFELGGLWRALNHSLNADYPTSVGSSATKLSMLFEFQQRYSTSGYLRRSWKK
jgi:hypothetical protein